MKAESQVVITGAGLVCSLGKDTAETWNALLSGKTGVRPVRGFDTSGFGPCFGAQTEGLSPDSLGVHPRDARLMDLYAFLLLKAGREAFMRAHPVHSGMSGEEMGFFAGMGMIDYKIDDLMPAVLKSLAPDGSIDYHAFYSDGYQQIHPLWPLSVLNNITFCQVAIDLGIRGENSVFCPHADGGMTAITEGIRNVLETRSRLVFAGGVSEKISPLSIARGRLSGILKRPSGNNSAGIRPFGDEDKGTVLGEGAGIIALELRSSADSRSVPYSVIINGYGHACERMDDGPAPTSRVIAWAMKQALETASLRADDIDLVIAHGDAALHSDRSEKEAIMQVFPGHSNLPVFSSKAALGHLLAAGPAVDIVLGMLIIENGIIPPAILEAGKEAIGQKNAVKVGADFNLVTGAPLRKKVRKIMINCQSYEGQCSSVILESVA
jgi:3-oxoacyl-[acyl-carrier-protein] synthase II